MLDFNFFTLRMNYRIKIECFIRFCRFIFGERILHPFLQINQLYVFNFVFTM